MVIAAGSYPAGRWFESDRRYQNGPMVKWLRHRPFTAVTRVRTSVGSPNNRLIQAVVLLGGLAQLVRALALQARGHRFKSSSLHHTQSKSNLILVAFFFCQRRRLLQGINTNGIRSRNAVCKIGAFCGLYNQIAVTARYFSRRRQHGKPK